LGKVIYLVFVEFVEGAGFGFGFFPRAPVASSLYQKSPGSFSLVSNSHWLLSFNFKFAKATILLFQRHAGFEN